MSQRPSQYLIVCTRCSRATERLYFIAGYHVCRECAYLVAVNLEEHA